MIFLHPINWDNLNLFENTSYAAMPSNAMEKMLAESLAKRHNGQYFELLAVMDKETCVGVVSLYETAPGEISCGPEIKPQYRRQGYGYLAMRITLDRANLLGYTKAIAQIRQDNAASIALHTKLCFSLHRSFTNQKGHRVSEFVKAL